MLRLNLGCGYNKREEYTNVDKEAKCSPDQILDLESLPWPWHDDSVTEILFNHSLEHLGQSTQVFLGIMKEVYRVCANQATILIKAPHPRHDTYLTDPTHVRPITPGMLALFDKELNAQWKRMRAANTPLGEYLDVDFTIVDVETILEEPYRSSAKSDSAHDEELEMVLRERNNIASEYRIQLLVRKAVPPLTTLSVTT